MKNQHVILILIMVNLAFLGFQYAHGKADQSNIPPILRARAFELVDDSGRLRAEIKVLPAQPDFKMPDGTIGYPEAVQLRLFTSKGGPNVKLGVTEDGSGLVLGGEAGSYVQILARGKDDPFVKIHTKDAQEKVFKP